MTEEELRALVREAIARHAGAGGRLAIAGPAAAPIASVRQHASHALLVIPSGAETDGPCIIEPAVPCTHCGYCRSYGH